MDTITIRDLEVFYRVGVPEAEREKAQRLLVTIEMKHDFARAAAADDLTRTIDYAAVSERLLAFGEGRSWKLIETLAHEIAQMILRDFAPTRVAVEIKKFILPQAKYVSVRVARPAA
jgi:7,8-dihydroneopterin aldolase/epimerase/oxygenase